MSIDRIDSAASMSSLLNLEEQVSRELGGDSGAEIAALLLLGARDSRERSRALRQAEEQRLTQFEQAEVESMYDQAAAIRAAGWSRGAGMILSGGLSIAGATVADPSTAATLGASGKVAEGTGTVLGAYEDGVAKMEEAAATTARNQAKKAERAIQDLGTSENEARELERTALQTASALIQTKAQGDQATLYLRG